MVHFAHVAFPSSPSYSRGPSIVPVARYSACQIGWSRREQLAVASYGLVRGARYSAVILGWRLPAF